ncbi:MAG: hypothetical protein H7Y13_03785 [Sphingobacteriaceae bacterium]|nr:hypothetical protein [Sphingobacteriaceae bacterium]
MSELNFSYKLVYFELPVIAGQEDRLNRQLQKIAMKVASLSGGPSAILKRDDRFHIAIPSDRHFEQTVINVVPSNVKVVLLPEIHSLHYSEIDESNVDVVQKFLDYEIRKQLSSNSQLWKLNSTQFFLKKPKYSNDESSINIYEGFTYKLLRLEDGNFYISLDLSSKYIDKHFLSHHINATNADSIGNRYKGKRCLYLNGDNWYATEIVGFGKPIIEHVFEHDGKEHNVYNYILAHAKSRKNEINKVMKPTDTTLIYKYPGRAMMPHNGATSLARIIYNTQDKEVQVLHKLSIKDPSRRFESISNYVKTYFRVITFNTKAVTVSKFPLVEKIRNFNFPELKFNNGELLKAGHPSTGAKTSLRDFASTRKQLIIRNGVLTKTIFDEQYLVVPDYLDKKLVEAFKKNVEYQIRTLAPAFIGYTIIRYKVLTNQSATIQLQEIERVLKQNNALDGFALFLLPDLSFDSKRHIKNFHDCLKNKFYPNLKVQCASSFKIKSFFKSYTAQENSNELIEFKVPEVSKPKFKSYIFNLAMEHLIVNRKWPFSLSKNLHYDIYIGIDVHDRHAGFTFFFKNGEKILFFPQEVPQKNRSQRAEKLKAGLLYDMIYAKLKEYIPMFSPNPNGIVIIRDGRSFGEEEKALRKVINTLASEGIINKETIKCGVVDLHKQSVIPLRIASQTNSYNNLENPMSGAYKLLNPKEGFIYNTGYPFQIPGSAKPLHLSLKTGDVEFIKVMEDLFCQAMLAFSAPDRSNSLPITIKLIDTLLEPLSGVFEQHDEDEEFEDSVIETI